MKTHQITSHDMIWHLATNHITSPHVTSQPTALLHRSLQPTTSKQVTTSPPWNGWRLVHSNNSVSASQWLVTLCTFYRQILSLTYSFFSLKLPPPACPALLVWIPVSYHMIIYNMAKKNKDEINVMYMAFMSLIGKIVPQMQWRMQWTLLLILNMLNSFLCPALPWRIWALKRQGVGFAFVGGWPHICEERLGMAHPGCSSAGDSSMVVIAYPLYGHVWIVPQLWEMVSSEFIVVQLRLVLIAVHVHKGNPGLPVDSVNFLFHSVRLSDFHSAPSAHSATLHVRTWNDCLDMHEGFEVFKSFFWGGSEDLWRIHLVQL